MARRALGERAKLTVERRVHLSTASVDVSGAAPETGVLDRLREGPAGSEPAAGQPAQEQTAEEVLQKIFDHIPVMINFTDRDGRIKLLNRQWERTFGWTLAEIESRSIDIFSECYPDPVQRREVLDFIARAGPGPAVFRARTRDGRVIDTRWFRTRLSDGSSIGLGTDITEHKRAEEELRGSREQLRALAARLQSVREDERTQVARELHDHLGQALTALRLDLSWLGGRLARSRSRTSRALVARTQSMIELVDRTVEAVRRTAADLRPGILDDLGLAAAVEWQAAEFQKRTSIRCEVAIRLEDAAPDPDPDVSTAVFRIVQEALTNVARHACAHRVRMALWNDGGHLLVEVADDGRGISRDECSGPGSLGLLGMRERARLLGGEVTIGGTQGRGTTVSARVPMARGERR